MSFSRSARLAVITGATAGIGAEFARQLAAAGFDLVLVARDAHRLDEKAVELSTRYGVTTEALVADLQAPDGLALVEKRVASSDRPVDFLVNNAGYGLVGQFEGNPVDEEQALLDLLVSVPMRLSHAALGQMIPRRTGTILNVASVAGFTPRGSYGAAKAWVLSFSRWANLHYKPMGIGVTAVAPGFVRTEFHDRMGVRMDGVPGFLWLSAERLVRDTLRDVARGKGISVPGKRYKLIVWLSSWLPARIVAAGALRGR